jgi:DNA primase
VISQETIAKVKERANLIEIIGESVSLRRQGANYVGICPFHSEKSPSFMVRDGGEGYHCFGCGAGGNVISYVMQTQGLSFPEAVEELASRFGVEVVYEQGSRQGVRTPGESELLYKINHLAQSYFLEQLQKGPELLHRYLEERNLEAPSREAFGVGFAPDRGGLVEYLKSRKIDDESMIKAGLVQRNQQGRIIDRFWGRVIFPIYIDGKRIAGFGGRILPGLFDAEREKRSPKYLNSPETEIYKKSKTLFGLPQASKAIRETGTVYLVEGYVDVIGLWRVGVHNVVATCGTAATDEHIKRIAHLAKRLIVLFDGDNAGRAAAAKMYPLTINSGLDIYAVFLDAEDDPDTFAAKKGEATAQTLSEMRKIPLFEVYLDSLIDMYSADGILGAAAKGKIGAEVQKHLSRIQNQIEKAALTDVAAMKLKVRVEELGAFVGKPAIDDSGRSLAGGDVETEAASYKIAVSTLPKTDQELLRAVIAEQFLIEDSIRSPIVCSQAHSLTVRFLAGVSAILGEDKSDSEKKALLKGFLQSLGDDWLELWRLAYKLKGDPRSSPQRAYRECLLDYEKSQLKSRVTMIEAELLTSLTDGEKVKLAQEKLVLSRRLKELGVPVR